MAEIKRMTSSNVDKNVKQLELSYIAGRSVKWHKYFGKQFGSCFKAKHTHIVKIANPECICK